MSDGIIKRDSQDNQKYPIMIDSHLYQYGEDVYVWFDEAGMASGAASTEIEARRQLQQYLTFLAGRK